jgi:hypothetical protein
MPLDVFMSTGTVSYPASRSPWVLNAESAERQLLLPIVLPHERMPPAFPMEIALEIQLAISVTLQTAPCAGTQTTPRRRRLERGPYLQCLGRD